MRGHQQDDTICAIATPLGEGGIGIVRISGQQAINLTSRVVKLRSGHPLQKIRSHTLYRGDIRVSLGQVGGSEKENKMSVLDEVLVVAMHGPRSYTGDDVVEIHCHGGPLILRTLCEALLKEGARLAEPGEFTKRAFLNGRLDLTQAEAVLDTIRATTSTSLRVAQGQLRGNLFKSVEGMRSELIRLLAQLEAGMDFVEEDISFIGEEELNAALDSLLKNITQLMNSFEEGRILREGIFAAIIGRPNVGKSSLLNALLQTDRAIVSTIPGTTRDVLEEVLNIKGIPLRMVDTAGLRETRDVLESEGIRRTTDAISQAEFLLIVVDGSAGLTENDVDIIRCNHEKKRLVAINKSDLACTITEKDIEPFLQSNSTSLPNVEKKGASVRISAKTGEGMDQLRREIRALVLGSHYESGDSVLVTRLRHKSSLERARNALSSSVAAIEQQLSGECIALDLRIALDALGEITGTVTTDEILDQIFREFCIGK